MIYRIDIETYVLDVYKFAVINHTTTLRDFDFLFILDIDEFLPFSERAELEEFLKNYLDFAVGTLYWKNAFTQDFSDLSLCPPIQIMADFTRTKKIFYNLKKVRTFIPGHGNHNARYPFLGQTLVQWRPRRKKDLATLIHIPIVGKSQILKKLTNFSSENFLKKISFDEDADFNVKNIYTKIANYREAPEIPRGEDDFRICRIFEPIAKDVHSLHEIVMSLPSRKLSTSTLKKEYLINFRSKGWLKLAYVRKLIQISSDLIISIRGHH